MRSSVWTGKSARPARRPISARNSYGRRAQARDGLGVREVDAVADVVGRGEQVRVDVDEHRRAVGVVVGVDGELLTLDDLLDHEVVQVQHLLRVQVAQRPDLTLDLVDHRRPGRGRLDDVHPEAEEAHRRLDDERGAQARRVEGAQLAHRHPGVAVVRVQVGDQIAEGDLVLEQLDPPRQVGAREVLGDPADGVLRVGVDARARPAGRGGEGRVVAEERGGGPRQPALGDRGAQHRQLQLADGRCEQVGHVGLFEDEHGGLAPGSGSRTAKRIAESGRGRRPSVRPPA